MYTQVKLGIPKSKVSIERIKGKAFATVKANVLQRVALASVQTKKLSGKIPRSQKQTNDSRNKRNKGKK